MDQAVLKKLDHFFGQYKLLNYKKGEVLVRPEDPIFGIYLLKKGYVRQYVITEDGEEVTINIFRPISFIPMMLVLSEAENKYYFEATEPIEVWRAPTDKTIEFLKSEPEVLFDLARRFAQGLIGLSQRMEELMSESAYQRVISLLLYLASRFGEKNDEEVVINLPMTHKDMAAWINLTRETTSRQLEKLEQQGLISQKGHLITVKNLSKLQDLV